MRGDHRVLCVLFRCNYDMEYAKIRYETGWVIPVMWVFISKHTHNHKTHHCCGRGPVITRRAVARLPQRVRISSRRAPRFYYWFKTRDKMRSPWQRWTRGLGTKDRWGETWRKRVLPRRSLWWIGATPKGWCAAADALRSSLTPTIPPTTTVDFRRPLHRVARYPLNSALDLVTLVKTRVLRKN